MSDIATPQVTPPPVKPRKPLYRQLYIQVLVAVVIGVILGYLSPHYAVAMKPLGDAFIALIKMVIGPIIFCTVVTGIAGMRDMRKVGRVGGKALIYFEVISSVALLFGLVAGHIFHPGSGFNVDKTTLNPADVASIAAQGHNIESIGFVLSIIPTTFVNAFARGDVLSILLISVLFGCALASVGERGKPVFDVIEAGAQVFFKIVHYITAISSIGAFGAIAFTIGSYGVVALLPLVKLIFSFYMVCVIFVLLILGLVAHLTGFSILRFCSYIKDELLIVLGTSSSEVVLAPLMRKLEELGCPKSTVGLVVPTGYSFNLDGTNIYLTMAILFIAQALNIDLTLEQQITVAIVGMLTSKGASGVAGAALVMLASTLSVVPVVPVAGMVLILGIHRFLGTGLAMTNLVGNGVAAIVVCAWEKELDRGKLASTLDART
ncbi:aerobic C4-dicarboxylate transport protein [Luteibacter sp. Sphag1AF]|uniref:C4-dicarboxylate transporter DctA n=1 Tax=Luteibacter sp. Sphag1AF TaxID=2587031 RepID=UPI00160E824E|nr:C4-dicarboxylate transporter DctA [Luteibacter sp. Sphag1AF]MBB3226814.1 aerobic C4-dicarboxylate transport protein [Luteibacter sp. Sphag1AF]